jgi:Ca2+-transporting ATPase
LSIQRPPYRQPAEAVLAGLAADPHAGLSEEGGARTARSSRQERAGGGKTGARLEKILRPVHGSARHPVLAATLISAGLWFIERESALPYEAIAILAVVLLNAVMGYIQQARAERRRWWCMKLGGRLVIQSFL